MTATHLQPDEPRLPTLAWLPSANGSMAVCPQDLVRDFVEPGNLGRRGDTRFSFGVRYRFMIWAKGGVPEASVPVIPLTWLVQKRRRPGVIDHLAFSRVGLNLRADQAIAVCRESASRWDRCGFCCGLCAAKKGLGPCATQSVVGFTGRTKLNRAAGRMTEAFRVPVRFTEST